MVDDHEDYETDAAPAAHKVSHQVGGTDEISVAGLAGETVELGAHKILPSIHHTKFTIAEHDLVVRHPLANLDGNVCSLASADIKINAHALLATVHQDAPDLILTHKGDASAHHAKYTDANARAAIYGTKPCFHCKLTSTQFNVTGNEELYSITGAIWTEIKDQGSIFSNGTFTAPDTGIYLLVGLIGLDGVLDTHTYGYANLVTSNRTYTIFSANPGAIEGGNTLYMPFSFYVDMDEDDTAYLELRIYNGATVIDVTLYTFFGGSRII